VVGSMETVSVHQKQSDNHESQELQRDYRGRLFREVDYLEDDFWSDYNTWQDTTTSLSPEYEDALKRNYPAQRETIIGASIITFVFSAFLFLNLFSFSHKIKSELVENAFRVQRPISILPEKSRSLHRLSQANLLQSARTKEALVLALIELQRSSG